MRLGGVVISKAHTQIQLVKTKEPGQVTVHIKPVLYKPRALQGPRRMDLTPKNRVLSD